MKTQMKEAFCLFDRDVDGLIDNYDFGLIIRSLGLNPTQQEINNMLKDKIDSMLNFEEFCLIAEKHLKAINPKDILTKAFKLFDRDGKGYISTAELKHVMLNLGEKLSPEEVENLIITGDPQNTGQIQIAEFANKLTCKK